MMRKKHVQSQIEYEKRLAQKRREEALIIHRAQEKITKSSIANWKRRVGPRFANATTERPEILDRVTRLATGTGLHKTSLVFTGGNSGAGKTWNAYAYLNLLVTKGIVNSNSIYGGSETAVLGRIASSGYKKPEMYDELFTNHTVFFIDDVGKGRFSNADGREEVWFELINHVYQNELTLVLTSPFKFEMLNDGTKQSRGLHNWIGNDAYDRLLTIAGQDGILNVGNVNMRPNVLMENERKNLK